MFAYIRFRVQRQIRRWRRQSRTLRRWSVNYFDRHLWGKWRQLGIIRRFVLGWWLIILMAFFGLFHQLAGLAPYYLKPGPAPGGVFAEGAQGSVQLVNPVLSDSAASIDLTKLVFNGLTQYDHAGHLQPDLATSWQVSADGKTYTFHLRHGVRWQDGVPFTSADVVFTLAAIQDPDTRSPLATSWQGITADAPDDYTVVYHLPNAYPPFLDATTQGIIPRHLLESVDPASLRANDFNQHPVGTGPYKVSAFLSDDHEVELVANASYYAGRPLIDQFNYLWFDSAGQLRDAYAKHQINAFAAPTSAEATGATQLHGVRLYRYSQPSETVLFLRNTQSILSDETVRAAINAAVDRTALVARALGGRAQPVATPLLPGQLGYLGQYRLPGFDLAQANRLLDGDGWVRSGRQRHKQGKLLELNLVTRAGGDYPAAAAQLADQLEAAGITVTVQTVDLTTLEQTYIRPRNFDMLLFGIDLGTDPDVYPYWQSAQADDPGLNLAQYKSPEADAALETARVIQDPLVRSGKYRTFQQVWQTDVPSVPLYSPDYTYVVSSQVLGLTAGRLIDPSDRFYHVERWAIESHLVLKRTED